MPSNKTKTRSKAKLAAAESAPLVSQPIAEGTSGDQEFADSLLFAVAEQKLEKVVEHISRGIDVNCTPVEGCSPLLLAVKLGHSEIVKVLLQHGASCSSEEAGSTALHHAAVNGFAEIARLLVEVGGAKLDKRNLAGCTPLYQAAQHGHIDCVHALLEQKADIEARTRSGATPMYIACDRGNLTLAEILLDAGANANVTTDLKMTPLLVAAFNGHADVVSFLFARKVDIEQRGPCGGTALYVAAQEGRRHVAEILIQQGAEIDARCDGDLTPSLIAAMQGHDEIVRLLLEAGGDLKVCTGKGSTLAIMAARHCKLNVLKTLVEVGGAAVLEGANSEGLSALGASKIGRRAESVQVTRYIESVLAMQKEAELKVWASNLTGLLEELEPSSKKKTNSKLKNKSKSNSSCPRSDSDFTSADTKLSGTSRQRYRLSEAVEDSNCDLLMLSSGSTSPTACGSSATPSTADDQSPEDAADESWTQVMRKKGMKPVLSILPPESPAALSATIPTPMRSPQVVPICSPVAFGLCSVMPSWPSTPEMWPHPADVSTAAAAFSFLPPSAMSVHSCGRWPATAASDGFSTGWDANCQSVFAAMAPWLPPEVNNHHWDSCTINCN